MKIGIPTFGTRVSPRFDCARTFLVVAVGDDGVPADRHELPASGWAPHERINRLLEQGVDTIVCGGIDCWSIESLQSAGVTVYGWVAGEFEEALAGLLRGDLESAIVSADHPRDGRRPCSEDQPEGAGELNREQPWRQDQGCGRGRRGGWGAGRGGRGAGRGGRGDCRQ